MLTAVINGVAKICGDADTADAWTRVFVPEILLVRTPSFSSFAHHSRRCREGPSPCRRAVVPVAVCDGCSWRSYAPWTTSVIELAPVPASAVPS